MDVRYLGQLPVKVMTENISPKNSFRRHAGVEMALHRIPYARSQFSR